MRGLLISVVGGVHVVLIGGVLFMQGCGTTRGPVALPSPPPMPPVMTEEAQMPPVRPVQPYRPVTIHPAAAAAAPVAEPSAEHPSPDASRTYVVGKGDSLSVIARRFGVSVADLMVLNNISNPDRIRLGQTLKLPSSSSPVVTAPVAKPVPVVPPAGAAVYEVKPGESLSVIAHRCGTTVKALQEANRLTGDRIQAGQKLILPTGVKAVPAATPVAAAPRPAPQASVARPPVPAVSDLPLPSLSPEPAPAAPSRHLYTVQAGDNILTVASEHNVSIVELRRVNHLTSDSLFPGQVLVIPAVE